MTSYYWCSARTHSMAGVLIRCSFQIRDTSFGLSEITPFELQNVYVLLALPPFIFYFPEANKDFFLLFNKAYAMLDYSVIAA